MKKIILIALLFISTFTTVNGQVASRLLNTQVNEQGISSPNFVWVDTSAFNQYRMYVAKADSLKIKFHQMKWLMDTISNKTSGVYKPISWFPDWSEILNRPSIPNNTAELINGAEFITALEGQIMFLPSDYIPSWSSIIGKPSFSLVATSGSYTDLSNKPTIPASQVNSDWNASSGVSQILNKPVFKREEVYSGTTSGSGTYTVTFAMPYSVAPNIQSTCTNCSDTQRARVTSVSTTGFTIQGRNEALGLVFTNANGLNIDVYIREK